MAFLDLYTLKTIQKLVKKNSGNIEDLQNQIRSLSQITLKNNLADQIAAGLRVTKTPTLNNDVSTKEYVDNKFNFQEIVTGTGNLKTTNLTGQQTGNNSGSTGIGCIVVEIKGNNIKHFINGIFKISDLSHKYTSQVNMFFGNNNNSNTITTLPTSGIQVIYDNQNIRLIKAGQDLPTNPTEIKIRRSKLG